jgi:hypothetical protein
MSANMMQIAAIGFALLLLGIVGVSLWRLQARVRAIRHAVRDSSIPDRADERRPAIDAPDNGRETPTHSS